jgi:imidazolonepropionase-like amidohydrolase
MLTRRRAPVGVASRSVESGIFAGDLPARTIGNDRAELDDVPAQRCAGASRLSAVALALTGLRVWDGRAAGYAEQPAAIRIEAGRIRGLGPDPALAQGARILDLRGATAIPGLCDAHVHLTLDPGAARIESQPAAGPSLEAVLDERARAMVEAGITTARDLGGGDWIELALRDRIARGEVVGPRLLCAGQPVTTRGGHGYWWGGEADGADEIRAVIRRQIERGVDWIKVMATGGVLTEGSRIQDPQFERAELELVVREARAHGRMVAAHCHGTEGIRRAAAAGVRTIEHCSWAGEGGFGSELDPEVAERIAANGTFVSPTVNAGWRRFLDGSRGASFRERMTGCFRVLRQKSVRMIASTDAGIPRVAHHRLPEALAVFARLAELSPIEALRAATSEAAEALGLAHETGALGPGLAADILVLEGDPLEDLEALRRPRLVVARGRALEPRASGREA